MTLEGDYDEGKSSVTGSLWLKIFDQQVQQDGKTVIIAVDQFSIPMTFIVPFRPTTMEITLKDGRAKLFLSITLVLKNGLPEESLDDITTIGLKWSNFDPLPHTVQSCCYWLAPHGFKLGSQLPIIKCDTRDENSFSRAFYMQKQAAAKSLKD